MKKWMCVAVTSLLFALGACSKAPADSAPKADDAAAADAAAADAAAADAAGAADAKAKTPQELLDSVEFTEEGLMGMFKTEKEVSPEEFEAVMLGFAKCDISNHTDPNETYLHYSCPASQVYKTIASYNSDWALDDASKQKTLMKLLKHENPVVREKAFENIDLYTKKIEGLADLMKGDELYAGDDAVLNAVVAIAKEEKDPAVFIQFYRRILMLDTFKSSPNLVAFAVEFSKSDNAAIRYTFADRLIGSRAKGQPDAAQAMLDLCRNDPDKKVQNAACGKILQFEIADNMKIAADILKNPDQSGAHGNIIRTLQERWFAYPDYDKFDADAYKLWLTYYKTKPRTGDVPCSMGTFAINDEKFADFKKNAKGFKEAEFADVMAAIAEDANADFMVRNDAVEAIGKLVSPAVAEKKLKAIDAKLAKRSRDEDRSANLIVDKIAKTLKK